MPIRLNRALIIRDVPDIADRWEHALRAIEPTTLMVEQQSPQEYAEDDAIWRAVSAGYDCILLPLSLPRLGSIRFIEFVIKYDLPTKIILISASEESKNNLKELYDGYIHASEFSIEALKEVFDTPHLRPRSNELAALIAIIIQFSPLLSSERDKTINEMDQWNPSGTSGARPIRYEEYVKIVREHKHEQLQSTVVSASSESPVVFDPTRNELVAKIEECFANLVFWRDGVTDPLRNVAEGRGSRKDLSDIRKRMKSTEQGVLEVAQVLRTLRSDVVSVMGMDVAQFLDQIVYAKIGPGQLGEQLGDIGTSTKIPKAKAQAVLLKLDEFNKALSVADAVVKKSGRSAIAKNPRSKIAVDTFKMDAGKQDPIRTALIITDDSMEMWETTLKSVVGSKIKITKKDPKEFDSEERVLAALTENYDCVLLPLTLPNYSAIRFADLTIKSDFSTRIVLVSGTEADREALEALFDSFIPRQEFSKRSLATALGRGLHRPIVFHLPDLIERIIQTASFFTLEYLKVTDWKFTAPPRLTYNDYVVGLPSSKTTPKNKEINGIPAWFSVAGLAFAAVTLVFFMSYLFVGPTIDSSKRIIIDALVAVSASVSFAFLGGRAAANGQIPGFKNAPVNFSVGGGIAVFVIILLIMVGANR